MTLSLNLLVYSAVALVVGFILTATPVATWWIKRMTKYMMQPVEEEMLSITEEFKAICQEDEDEEK